MTKPADKSSAKDESNYRLADRLSSSIREKLLQTKKILEEEETMKREEKRKAEEVKRREERKRLENDFQYLLDHYPLDWKKFK